MKRRNVFWGVFLVLAAVLVIAGQVTGFAVVGFWSILATVLLVALLVECIVRLNLPVAFLSVALLYLIYQKPLALPFIQPWLLLLAALLAGIGLSILVRPSRWRKNHTGQHSHINGHSGGQGQAMSIEESGDDNDPQVSISFGASTRYLHSTALRSGVFKASFGSLEVYFDQAALAPEGAEILVDCSFGSLVLYIPRHWPVKDDVSVSLGGMENDTGRAQPDPGSPQLLISGSVSIGSVEIKYI